MHFSDTYFLINPHDSEHRWISTTSVLSLFFCFVDSISGSEMSYVAPCLVGFQGMLQTRIWPRRGKYQNGRGYIFLLGLYPFTFGGSGAFTAPVCQPRRFHSLSATLERILRWDPDSAAGVLSGCMEISNSIWMEGRIRGKLTDSDIGVKRPWSSLVWTYIGRYS